VSNQTSNATTLLYSGKVGDVPAWQIANQIGSAGGGNIVVIGDTPVANFLEDPRFISALENIVGTGDATVIKTHLNGTIAPDGTRTLGMWDITSKNLAQAASGDVRTITPLAEQGKVFIQTELPALLNNPNVKSINGHSIEDFRTLYERGGKNADALQDVAKAGINGVRVIDLREMQA